MNIDLITKVDLEQFKIELLEELYSFIRSSQNADKTSKYLLRSIEVRELLGISGATLQNLRLNGTLPYSKVGGIIYYKYDDIIKLIEKNSKSECGKSNF